MLDLAAELSAIATALGQLDGVDTASTDPAELVAPGVLVQLAAIGTPTLAGRQLDLQLLLVVPDSNDAAAQLGQLLAAVETYASADGPIRATTVVLPGATPVPLPGLAFPLTHYVTEV
jgi:hypothetical protein